MGDCEGEREPQGEAVLLPHMLGDALGVDCSEALERLLSEKLVEGVTDELAVRLTDRISGDAEDEGEKVRVLVKLREAVCVVENELLPEALLHALEDSVGLDEKEPEAVTRADGERTGEREGEREALSVSDGVGVDECDTDCERLIVMVALPQVDAVELAEKELDKVARADGVSDSVDDPV